MNVKSYFNFRCLASLTDQEMNVLLFVYGLFVCVYYGIDYKLWCAMYTNCSPFSQLPCESKCWWILMRRQPISDSRFWYLNYNYHHYTIAIINGTFPFGTVGHWTTGKRIKRNSHSGEWLFEMKNDSLLIWCNSRKRLETMFLMLKFCDSFEWNGNSEEDRDQIQ